MGLEDLLAHPHIWRGRSRAAKDGLPTGFAALDRYLPGGGWPRRAVTEIYLEHYGIGELSLLMPALAGLCRESEALRWIVWVAPPFVPYAPALRRRGIDLDRVLLVHPSTAQVRRAQMRRANDVLWAVEQTVRSGSSIAVLAWLEEAGHLVLRRLQLAAEANGCWTVLFRPVKAMRQISPAVLRMKLSRREHKARVEIFKCRGAKPKVVDLE